MDDGWLSLDVGSESSPCERSVWLTQGGLDCDVDRVARGGHRVYGLAEEHKASYHSGVHCERAEAEDSRSPKTHFCARARAVGELARDRLPPAATSRPVCRRTSVAHHVRNSSQFIFNLISTLRSLDQVGSSVPFASRAPRELMSKRFCSTPSD
jgi:hypothetical protein